MGALCLSPQITLQIMSFEVESQHENASPSKSLLSTRDLHYLGQLQGHPLHLHLRLDSMEHHFYLSMPCSGWRPLTSRYYSHILHTNEIIWPLSEKEHPIRLVVCWSDCLVDICKTVRLVNVGTLDRLVDFFSVDRLVNVGTYCLLLRPWWPRRPFCLTSCWPPVSWRPPVKSSWERYSSLVL